MPRSRSRSPSRERHRRRPSPDYSYEQRRRSRSPDHRRGRGAPPHREPPPGPPPRPGYGEAGRNDRGGYDDGGGQGWQGRGAGGRGGQRGGGDWIGGDVKSYGVHLQPHLASQDSDIDSGLPSNDYTEFRRLKRLELIKLNRYCIWDNTPSPSPSPERSSGASDEEAVTAADIDPENASEPGVEQPPVEAQVAAAVLEVPLPPEEPENELDKEEAALLKTYLDDMRAVAEAAERARAVAEEENAFVGPELPSQAKAAANTYGKALLPGEGEAMAAFVQSGKRIPRRGEVGLSADEISTFEDLGYIMSGSRHSRMNAIRIRKENQIYTAEEKAALAQLNFEEKAKKEKKVLEDMKKLVEQSVIGPGEKAD